MFGALLVTFLVHFWCIFGAFCAFLVHFWCMFGAILVQFWLVFSIDHASEPFNAQVM